MHFLIATAALLSAATLATANPLIKISIGPPPAKVTCRIIGQTPVIVRDCPSQDCNVSPPAPQHTFEHRLIPQIGDDAIQTWSNGRLLLLLGRRGRYQSILGGTFILPPRKLIRAVYVCRWWDYSADGFFPDVYVEQSCAGEDPVFYLGRYCVLTDWG